MKNLKAYYTEPQNFTTVEVNISSIEALENLVSKVVSEISSKAGSPVGIDIEREDGATLSVAPSEDGWALILSFNDEQRCSIGNTDIDGVEPFYFEQWTEIPKSWLVPKDKAWLAVKEWSEEGTLSDEIKWSADCA